MQLEVEVEVSVKQGGPDFSIFKENRFTARAQWTINPFDGIAI